VNGLFSVSPVSDDHHSRALSCAYDSTGRLVVGGWSSPSSSSPDRFALIRLTAPQPRPVSVSGRVTDSSGNSVSGVMVTTQGGLTARTSPFGYYTMNNVPTNRTYTFSARSKGDMAFNKRVVLVDDQITGLDFIGEQPEAARSKNRRNLY
jgi:hypothetical protein